ncbi:hypothetical protein DBR06_SOUSAS15810038, partial [Sousa chinensis]
CRFRPTFLPEEVETTEPAKEWRASLEGRKEPPAGPPASGGHAEGDGGLESLQTEKRKVPGFRGNSCSRGRTTLRRPSWTRIAKTFSHSRAGPLHAPLLLCTPLTLLEKVLLNLLELTHQ